jgi:hypothetical protein
MAAVFLVLLYNSPSSLVLYWTGNNVFSLLKNGIQKTKYPKPISLILVAILCYFVCFYLLFIHKGRIVRRVEFASIFALVPFLPLLYKFLDRIKKPSLVTSRNKEDNQNLRIFLFSLFVLFLLGGLVIPSSLIASSVQEFSFIENYTSPLPFILNTALQSVGIFLLWPLCIYSIFPQNIKRKLAKLAAAFAIASVINVFLFPGSYGSLSLLFIFSQKFKASGIQHLLNWLVIIIIVFPVFLSVRRTGKIIGPVLVITICTFMLVSIVNLIKIRNEFKLFQSMTDKNRSMTDETVYQFSTEGKNVLVITLDRGISRFIPFIFEEKPELYNSFDGFIWYKNTVSFGGYTNFGVPGLFGGYEYTPLEMQERKDVPLVEKHNEALLLLPKLFLEHDFRVTVTDPPYANYSLTPDLNIFADYPQITAVNIIGKYADLWAKNKNMEVLQIAELIKTKLIRFSLFKFVPLIFKNFVYEDGIWLSAERKSKNIPSGTLDNYIALDVLPDITKTSEAFFNTYNVLSNNLTHEPHLLQPPDYTPSNEIAEKAPGTILEEEHYHVNIAALLLLGKWFDFLRENGVYNNTRIIVVSDHGRDLYSEFPDNIVLPDGHCLEFYAALLLVKDFGAHGELTANDSFMTNADVPLIALKDIIENPVNPLTGKILESDKSNGVYITTSELWRTTAHQKYQFNIKSDEWLHIHDNIFDPENWRQVRK